MATITPLVTTEAPPTATAPQPTGPQQGVPPVTAKNDYSEQLRPKTAAKTVKLTDLLKVEAKKEVATEAEVRIEYNDPFTPEQLQKAWNEFAEQRKKLQTEYMLLTQPYDFQNNTIIVHLHNPVQEMILNNLRADLITYVREKLRNTTIQLTGEHRQPDERKVIYTNREKFDYLLNKNPLLRELKDRLNLDTDF